MSTPAAHTIRRRLARTALVAFAVFCLSRAVSYWTLADDPIESVPAIAEVFDVPIITWAFVWLAAAIFTAAFIPKVRAWGYAPTVGLGLFWATGYLWLIPGDDTLRSIANACLYLVIACLAWIAALLTHRRGLLA